MSDITEKLLDSAFLYLQPWFYNNKLALRCELGIGQGKEYINNAVGRALKIANILFEDKKIDTAFYNQYFDNNGQVFVTGDFELNIDKVVDLDIDLLNNLDQIDEDIAAVKRYISYEVSFTALESILKNQIDNQLNPLVSFVSFDNQFIFSVYDDRGCDIVFFDEEKYKEFYSKLEPYLLDYDRERMRKTFDSLK